MHEEMKMNWALHGFLATLGYICTFSYIVGSIVLDVLR